MTPAGIEPATFRFVAQHLNHCATAVPHLCKYPWKYSSETCTNVVQLANYDDITFPRQKDFLTPDIQMSCVVNHTVHVYDKPHEDSAEYPAACFKILLSNFMSEIFIYVMLISVLQNGKAL